MTDRDSVFLRALGDQADRLRPEVREYVEGPPAGYDRGVGHGMFDVAGSPYRRAAGALKILAGPALMVTAYERDVPFEIVNRPYTSGRAMSLSAKRAFFFRGGTQSFVDELRVGRHSGTLVNALGRDRRIELLLACEVTGEGNLLLRSFAARIRIGHITVRLPRLLSVAVRAIDGWDEQHARRTIDVSVRNPILGTVMRYRGWFEYDYASSQ